MSSDRNRPEQLGSGPTHLEFLKEGIEAGVAPDRVGALVVDGIRNDVAYIFTEPALRAAFEQRVARIYADFERIPD